MNLIALFNSSCFAQLFSTQVSLDLAHRMGRNRTLAIENVLIISLTFARLASHRYWQWAFYLHALPLLDACPNKKNPILLFRTQCVKVLYIFFSFWLLEKICRIWLAHFRIATGSALIVKPSEASSTCGKC